MEDPRRRDWVYEDEGTADRRLDELTTTYRHLLVEYLSPKTGFLTGLGAFLRQEDLDDIETLERQSRSEAVEKLLDILQNCKQPGVYSACLQSLKQNKMGHLAEMIEKGNGPSERLRHYRFLIESFLPELIKVDPTDLLPHLSCLTYEDKEIIMNVQTQYSSDKAALKLILCLGLCGEEWLRQLVDALSKCRYRRLASAIAQLAGIHSEEINPKTFASESQEADDFWRCTNMYQHHRSRMSSRETRSEESTRDTAQYIPKIHRQNSGCESGASNGPGTQRTSGKEGLEYNALFAQGYPESPECEEEDRTFDVNYISLSSDDNLDFLDDDQLSQDSQDSTDDDELNQSSGMNCIENRNNCHAGYASNHGQKSILYKRPLQTKMVSSVNANENKSKLETKTMSACAGKSTVDTSTGKSRATTGQQHIEEMIKSGQRAPSKDSLRNKHLISQYQSLLAERIRPIEVCSYLPCLSREEVSEIVSCTDNHGPERGALKMLSYLVLKGDDMFKQLLTGLRRTGNSTIASQLESEIRKDLRRLRANKQVKPEEIGAFGLSFPSHSGSKQPGNSSSRSSTSTRSDTKQSSIKTKSVLPRATTAVCKSHTSSASGEKKPAARSITNTTRARSSKLNDDYVDSCAKGLSRMSLDGTEKGKGARPKEKRNGSTVVSTKTLTTQSQGAAALKGNSQIPFIAGSIFKVEVRWKGSLMVADISLKTKAVKPICVTCYHQELKEFFRSNGDALSNFRSKEKLKEYIEDKKTLRIQLNANKEVIKLINGN